MRGGLGGEVEEGEGELHLEGKMKFKNYTNIQSN